MAFLLKILGNLVKFFSVGKSMNDYQLTETAKLILKEFYYLNVDDYKLFFDRLKSGYYGQLYDRLDGNVILVHLRDYANERMMVSEELVNVSHALQKQVESSFFIKVGDSYIREVGNEYDFVSIKELATTYDYTTALKIKKEAIKEGFEDVKIVDVNKPDETILGYVKKNAPHLIPKEPLPQDKLIQMKSKRVEIQNDLSLTDLERENKLRDLAGMQPLTSTEFELRQIEQHLSVCKDEVEIKQLMEMHLELTRSLKQT